MSDSWGIGGAAELSRRVSAGAAVAPEMNRYLKAGEGPESQRSRRGRG